MLGEIKRVINLKLFSIGETIEEIINLNKQIDKLEEDYNYVRGIIDIFEDKDNEYDVHNFVQLKRNDFDKVVMLLDDEVLNHFGTNSCNYEGLIYLIKGINSGINLSLTNEQDEAIRFMIHQLIIKKDDYLNNLNGLKDEKNKYKISDLDTLNEEKNKYEDILNQFNNNDYIMDIDSIIMSLEEGNSTPQNRIDTLIYVLKYNADIYKNNKVLKNVVITKKDESFDNKEERPLFEHLKNKTEKTVNIPELENELKEQNKFDRIDLTNTNTSEFDFDRFQEENLKEKNKVVEIPYKEDNNEYDREVALPNDKKDENIEVTSSDNKIKQNQPVNIPLEEEQIDDDFKDIVKDDYESVINAPKDGYDYNNVVQENMLTKDIENIKQEITETKEENNEIKEIMPTIEIQENVLVKDAENTKQEMIETKEENNEIKETMPTIEVQKNVVSNSKDPTEIISILDEYDIKYNAFDIEGQQHILNNGNLDTIKSILETLKKHNIINMLFKNIKLFPYILTNSSAELIDQIMGVIRAELSVDDEDFLITSNIFAYTLPTVMVRGEFGNYDNFILNIKSFKDWGIDLINLFDFSKEVFVMNHDKLIDNYNLTRSYDFTINAHNAKYFLMLDDLGSKIDYFVEAIYKDNMKGGTNQVFDGSEYIKLYPSKLNKVKDETIKRLRYSSENALKVFGSKEKSLTGEITNLDVNILNIPDEYRRQYFNNEFDIIERGEVDDFISIVNNSNEIDNILDEELTRLEPYRVGRCYQIENINISYNKVLRIYNRLIKARIDKKKALLFAICYNTVITKDEYTKLKTFVNNLIGGK